MAVAVIQVVVRLAALALFLLATSGCATKTELPEPRRVEVCDERMIDHNRRACAERDRKFVDPSPAATCGRCAP